MEPGKYLYFNEKIIKTGKAIITADNRSFRFGDGFFETMKMIDGNIPLLNYHLERLFSSLEILKFEKQRHFTGAYLSEQIKNIVLKNKHAKAARIRLTVFRGDGSLYDYENDYPNYIIQTWQLPSSFSFNKTGLVSGIYLKARKSSDDFSHIKSNNYLPCLMAALWAKENKLNEAIILNNYNRVAEATIANIFLVNDGKIQTPALSEGCVGGVMRKFLIECLKKENIPFEETAIETEALLAANEVFTTNASAGITPVTCCEKSNYSNKLAEYLHNKFVLPLFAVKQ